jgi:hypothetical protein
VFLPREENRADLPPFLPGLGFERAIGELDFHRANEGGPPKREFCVSRQNERDVVAGSDRPLAELRCAVAPEEMDPRAGRKRHHEDLQRCGKRAFVEQLTVA